MARVKKQRQSDKKEKRLIGYVRVSTDEQVHDGNSLDAQRSTITAWSRNNGHTLCSIACDAGRSGTLPPEKRDGLREALSQLRAGEADGLIFVKLDRLSRSLRDILSLRDDSLRRGWDIISCHERIDTTDTMGKFMFSLMGSLAEMEVDRVSERVVHGLRHLTLQGRVHTPKTPFGFRLGHADGDFFTAKRPKQNGKRVGEPDRRPLVENEEEQAILEYIVRHMDEGGTAYRAAITLNVWGVRHPRGSIEWRPGSVESIYRTAVRRREILRHHAGL